MKTPRSGWRMARILGLVLLGLVLAVYIGLPVAMAGVATWPSRASVGEPPSGFRDVELRTAEGDRLAAWYAAPQNGTAIILVHGAGGSREDMRPQAVMLAREGYGVLALDLEGHGRSGGATNRLGWVGTRDVEAAVAFLKAENPALGIGALGASMGGEVLLGASAACPEVRAIVAEGATRRCTAELLSLPSERPIVRSFVARVMYASVGLFARQRPPAPLLDEMRRATATRFMLIAAGGNDLEVAFNTLFREAMGNRASLWIAPGVQHLGARARYPAEYERRVLEYFATQLHGDQAGASSSSALTP